MSRKINIVRSFANIGSCLQDPSDHMFKPNPLNWSTKHVQTKTIQLNSVDLIKSPLHDPLKGSVFL